MFQAHYQVLRPLTTAHLAQTMTLLSLTANELREQIEKELSENPALELIEERRCPTCHRILPDKGSCPVCSRPQKLNSEEPVVFVSPREDFYSVKDTVEDDIPEDNYSTQEEELPIFVLKQIAPDLDQSDRQLAAFLLTHLDEDGFLTISLLEAAQYLHFPISRIEKIQKLIQRAEPIGVGSFNAKSALLVQMEVLSETRPIPELAFLIVSESMDLLEHRQYIELARKYQTTIREIQQIVKFISNNLNPFPGRSHWGEAQQSKPKAGDVFHQPDILIGYLNDDPINPLVVEIIMPISGTLRVNPLFKQAIHETAEDKREEWKKDIEKASLFVKCIQQRNQTMTRMMSRLVMMQKNFILNGDKHLIPVTRAEISRELGVHESTISRAVANKAIQLPNKKIIALAEFFDRSLNIRTVMRDFIVQEKRPLSDTDLVGLLAQQGFNVARRTVAKYRAMEGILPAHLRRSVVKGK
jgi:RNA polymerase sigma-54 factor